MNNILHDVSPLFHKHEAEVQPCCFIMRVTMSQVLLIKHTLN